MMSQSKTVVMLFSAGSLVAQSLLPLLDKKGYEGKIYPALLNLMISQQARKAAAVIFIVGPGVEPNSSEVEVLEAICSLFNRMNKKTMAIMPGDWMLLRRGSHFKGAARLYTDCENLGLIIKRLEKLMNPPPPRPDEELPGRLLLDSRDMILD